MTYKTLTFEKKDLFELKHYTKRNKRRKGRDSVRRIKDGSRSEFTIQRSVVLGQQWTSVGTPLKLTERGIGSSEGRQSSLPSST